MAESKKENLPHITMAVLGYNQENSIGYAIESALNQDYEGDITFVFSDDCSSDKTFAIMQEKASAYQGRHKIILNRNKVNKKHAGNLFAAFALAPADYYCKQDGDDYSAPHRVSALVQAFMQNKEVMFALGLVKKMPITSLDNIGDKFHNAVYEGDGTMRIAADDDYTRAAFGGVGMWSAKVIEVADKMNFSQWQGIYEDNLMMYYARLFGEVAIVDKELVCYVLHQNNSSWVERNYRYSSFAAYQETEQKLQEINRNAIPLAEKSLDAVQKCMQTFPEIDAFRRRRMENCLAFLEQDLCRKKNVLQCQSKGFCGRLVHWLTHRDVGLSIVLPARVKYAVVRTALAIKRIVKK